MAIILGLDIGSNSVGSAWIDTERKFIQLGVSVFPAGVDETDTKRGAPKNQKRREKRSQRRSLARRAARKRKLREVLTKAGLLPTDPSELKALFDHNCWPVSENREDNNQDYTVWHLRRDALKRELSPYEFGRVLVHLNQRRGALGLRIESDEDDKSDARKSKKNKKKKSQKNSKADGDDASDKKVHAAVEHLRSKLNGRTVGQFMADEMEARRIEIEGKKATHCQAPIRNRSNLLVDHADLAFHAERPMVREEFMRIWDYQRSLKKSPLSSRLTDELKHKLDDSPENWKQRRKCAGTVDKAQLDKLARTWRHAGVIFGQRRTYWKTGTLGRCDLEPTDRHCPFHDMHAQHYRTIETVNNIRIRQKGEVKWRSLNPSQREAVLGFLRGEDIIPLRLAGFPKASKPRKPVKEVKFQHIREILGIDKKTLSKLDVSEGAYELNIEKDEKRDINTDRFWRDIVVGVFGVERWGTMTDTQRESVNRALLKFDTETDGHENRLKQGAQDWWGLDDEAAEKLLKAWRKRGRSNRDLYLSRRAILNILPYMEKYDRDNDRWPTQIEAKQLFAGDLDSGATPEQRIRYAHTVTDRLRDTILRQLEGDVGEYEHLLRLRGSTRKERHYLAKHPEELLPPAPMLSNPVVRKAIHEVRRHVIAHLRTAGRRPDRIVIEFIRGVKLSQKDRNKQLSANRKREEKRKDIEKELRRWGIPESNWQKAMLRVRLCEEQAGICPFSIEGPNASRIISPRMAAEGRDVEFEHIIPQGITGGTRSYNELVLCFRDANQAKEMNTPLDWLGADGVAKMLQRLEKAPIRKNKTKWKNLQVETPDLEDYRNSQLTDTAYAARQVADYLRTHIFDGEADGKRRIFTTKGEFTGRLRADWGLYESEIDKANQLEPEIDPDRLKADPELEQALRRARKEPAKDRVDHRHHALDAIVIAMTGPEMLTELGKAAETVAKEAREYRKRTGHRPRRKPMPPPWGTTEAFRQQAIDALGDLIVSHRPIERKIAGAFHEGDAYGPAVGPLPPHRPELPREVFSLRMPIFKNREKRLKPGHLRVPSGWDELSAHLDDPDLSDSDRMAIRRRLSFLVDPRAGKGGIVRDRTVRDRVRKCLRASGVDPDHFTLADIRQVAEEAKLTMPSGVPIKSVILLRTMKDPVLIPRKVWDPDANKMVPEMDPDDPKKPHPISRRVYVGGNNHHIGIREDAKGKWSGVVVPTFDAAKRNAQRLRALKKAGVPSSTVLRRLSKPERANFKPIISRINGQFPIVDRSDNDDGRFVMSLAEGETVYMRHPKTGEPGYFVVFKLDKPRTIHFQHHWDARSASGRKDEGGARIPGSKREDVPVSAPDLKRKCSLDDDTPPYKVQVSPLGEIRKLEQD
ncbi:MAG: hypothetical protein KAY37_06790 [Phycisphaerae bacterium]|nr:hypothetical protein [Phycisphaerae bacterium]